MAQDSAEIRLLLKKLTDNPKLIHALQTATSDEARHDLLKTNGLGSLSPQSIKDGITAMLTPHLKGTPSAGAAAELDQEPATQVAAVATAVAAAAVPA